MVRKKRELKVPFWFVDGFVGILALVIYNFVLYLLTVLGIGGIIEKIEDAMGYFLLKSFMDFGFSATKMIFGLVIVFVLAFFMGVGISTLVRRKKKYRGKVTF